MRLTLNPTIDTEIPQDPGDILSKSEIDWFKVQNTHTHTLLFSFLRRDILLP